MALLLAGACVWGRRETPPDRPCSGLAIAIGDADERLYVTEDELAALLQKEQLYPVGRTISSIPLQRIERTVLAHPMVRTAECYATPRNEIRVRLTQRVPLLRVQVPGEMYYVDEDRTVMPARAAIKDPVLVIRGNVGSTQATTELADFARWLRTNRYWRERVSHVYVQSPQMVYLYQGAGNPRIVLGNMEGYTLKLANLRTFNEKGGAVIKDKQYTELDVRFRGQVIGR